MKRTMKSRCCASVSNMALFRRRVDAMISVVFVCTLGVVWIPPLMATGGNGERPRIEHASPTRALLNVSSIALPAPPEVRARKKFVELTLRAVTGADGHRAFSFNGHTVPPTIRVSPGDTLTITYINRMSKTSTKRCASGSCMNMTNLHFHGLGVSKAPQDDVLDMMAMPGETLNYVIAIPREQPPGLYWYHTHPHGESQREALDGMSGAIVVEGVDR
jgi:FtsP/CotA-like multicopper oxidase with cupredoxin domain